MKFKNFFKAYEVLVRQYRGWNVYQLPGERWVLKRGKHILDEFPNRAIFEHWLVHSDYLTEEEKWDVFVDGICDYEKFYEYANYTGGTT